ncbi:MAG: trypsin-like peptidase domain-containing protein [Candidatus Wildermuthbacteria bacterium]|nr:trypsin-like peptidase domain-containing protein [Candidatus Wildermuthbacteria bacterium]
MESGAGETLKKSAASFFAPFLTKQVAIAACVFLAGGLLAGGAGGLIAYHKISKLVEKAGLYADQQKEGSAEEYAPQTTQEQKIIDVVKASSPAVVSIVISKDVPIMEQYFTDPFGGLFGGNLFQIPQYRQKGTEKKEIGGGTGFFVSAEGMLITNKHVVLDDKAEYTVFTVEGDSYPAKVLSKDPVQDIAVLQVERNNSAGGKESAGLGDFPFVSIGNSDSLQIGQTVVAIGNALGEFRNTVSVGVISGLGRTVTAAGDNNFLETLEDIIQTDAAINPGNSGGPLLNLAGEVIGMNTATAQGAQSIGFAIPVNRVMRDIEQVSRIGKIVYPFLGVQYVLISEKIAEDKDLPVSYGALLSAKEEGDNAISPGSGADNAGLKTGDIILEFNGEKITQDNSLSKIIQKYDPGREVSLKILRAGKEFTVAVTLGERTE